MTPRRSIQWGAIGITLLVAGPAWAAWNADYVRARQAFQRGDHATAIRLLEDVIVQRPQPVASARLQSRGTEPYLPQLLLGLALLRQNNCARAMTLLQDQALSAVLATLPKERAERDAAVQRCMGPTSSPVAAIPAALPTEPVPAPEPASPEPPPEPPPQQIVVRDSWLDERNRVIALVEAYAAQATVSLPGVDGFQSPRARQWILVLTALQSSRQAAAAADGSADQRRLATTAAARLDEARALGALPKWEALASPRQRSFLR